MTWITIPSEVNTAPGAPFTFVRRISQFRCFLLKTPARNRADRFTRRNSAGVEIRRRSAGRLDVRGKTSTQPIGLHELYGRCRRFVWRNIESAEEVCCRGAIACVHTARVCPASRPRVEGRPSKGGSVDIVLEAWRRS